MNMIKLLQLMKNEKVCLATKTKDKINGIIARVDNQMNITLKNATVIADGKTTKCEGIKIVKGNSIRAISFVNNCDINVYLKKYSEKYNVKVKKTDSTDDKKAKNDVEEQKKDKSDEEEKEKEVKELNETDF